MRRMRVVAAATIVGLLAAPPIAYGQPPRSGTVREAESGTPFPVAMTPPGAATPYRLMGTGIREATWFRVNVYAFGLYVHAAGAESALADFAGRAPEMLRRDSSFHRRLLDVEFGMALRLVMVRSVDARAVADAFYDALGRRMVRARRHERRDGVPAAGRPPHGADDHAAALARLRRYLVLDEVRRDTEVVFSCDATGRLAIRVDRARRPDFVSRALCQALFDVYLGKDPVSRDGRRDIIAGLAALVADLPRSARVFAPLDSARHGLRPRRTPG